MTQMQTKESKLKLFIDNFLIYGFGGVIGKAIPLMMLPIVTRLMPDTSYFGISDLSSTIVSFCSAIAIMGMYDAMYRMFFEKNELLYKKKVCSTTIFFTLGLSVVVSLIMVLARDYIARFVFRDIKYAYVVYISAAATLVSATNTIVSAPTRMQNQRRIFIISHAVGPMIAYAISIPLILKGYYIIALPMALFISSAIIEASFLMLNRKWFSLKLFDKKLLKQMLIIGVPLFPNFLIYWLFNSCDKLMITHFINVGAEGVYSVGSKLGQLSQLIYTAFAGGWQFFAFTTMNEDNQVEANSRIFEYLGMVSFIASTFVFVFSKPLFQLLFRGDYVNGFIVSPYLFMAPLMQMLFQVIGNQFLVIKKTWPAFFILMGGAILNIILNITLIPTCGIEGAAIATLFGYISADIICCFVLVQMRLMIISSKFLCSCMMMISFIILWRLMLYSNFFGGLLFACVCSSFFCWLYRIEIVAIIGGLKRMIKKKYS